MNALTQFETDYIMFGNYATDFSSDYAENAFAQTEEEQQNDTNGRAEKVSFWSKLVDKFFELTEKTHVSYDLGDSYQPLYPYF